jgi:hypothetical protein
MKQNQLLRFLTFFLFSSILIQGCQEDNGDETLTNEKNYLSERSIVSLDDIPIIKNFLSDKTHAQFDMNMVLSERPGTTREQGDLIIGDIDIDHIIETINGPNAVNYAFQVAKEGGGETFSLINLVIEQVGDYISYYFIEYEFDENYIQNKEDNSLLDFTGRILTYNPEGIYVGTIDIDNGSPTQFEYRHPCLGDPGGGNGSTGQGPLVSTPPGPNCTWELTEAITPCTCEGHTNPIECECTPQASVMWEWAWVCDDGMKAASRHPCTQVSDPTNPVEETCYQPNTEPCPFGCDPSGDGSCAEDPNINTGINDGSTNTGLDVIMAIQDLIEPNMTQTQINWIYDNPGFADEALGALENGGTVNIDDRVIFDSSFIDAKSQCIYEMLKDSNSDLFKNTIENFIDNPKYHIKFTIGENGQGARAITNTDNLETTGVIEIRISPSADSGNPLDLADDILHEGIHAEIYRYVNSYQANEDPNDKPRIFQLYEYYQTLYGPGDIQHIYMTENYVIPIATALRSLDDNSYPLDHYMDIAWDGLRFWDANNLLDMEEDPDWANLANIARTNTEIPCE